VDWYNDSKGTNVGAALSAIHGLPGPLVLIAGGQGKGADFTPLRQALAAKVRVVVLLGEDAPKIEAALAGVVPVLHATDMDAAVKLARDAARPGDSVLLSPACASFDMFSGYAQRGEVFMAAVREAHDRFVWNKMARTKCARRGAPGMARMTVLSGTKWHARSAPAGARQGWRA
jgi:UDP-N-acetylmuramoylalanine--D-glutamate ligase